ncbi:MAG: PDZ domain-containing protein, partial [Acidobacteria bacterium]|nr:PDZ domain-containing protein [Acidobacteriota bacterium]
MRTRPVSTLLLVFACLCPPLSALSPVHYVVSLSSPEQHLLGITVEVPAGTDTREFQLPVWNALYQRRDFSQYVEWIRAQNPSGQALEIASVNASRWQIAGTGRGARISYQVFADIPGPYGAQLNAQHAFFNLAEILIFPEEERNQAVELQFHDVPAQWKIATTLEQQAGTFRAANYDRLVDSPVEIGRFEERNFSAACGQYRLIMDDETETGTESRAGAVLEKLIPTVRRIVSAATEWMNDCPYRSFLFLFHVSDLSAGGGMEHSSSTAISLPGKDFLNLSGTLVGMTAHEFFHLWNVKRIRPQSLEPIDYSKENYTTALWFSEGVDSTVASYITLRARLLDEGPYLKHLSEEITELENRPAHLTQSAEQSSLDAWLERYPYYGLPERSISYYNKGELLGVLLDLSMRQASDDHASLRELFRSMNERYAKAGKFFADSEAVRQTAELVSHADLSDFFRNYVSGVEEIPWDKFFGPVGLHVSNRVLEFAEPGFVAVQQFDQPPTVAEIKPGGPADSAGLKVGDIIVGVNGQNPGRQVNREIAGLVPGTVVRLSVSRGSSRSELAWKLETSRHTVYQLVERQ